MNSFGFAKTFPEFNEVMNTLFKKESEILNYSDSITTFTLRAQVALR